MNVLLNFLVATLLNTNKREKLYSLLVVGNCGYTLVSNPLCNILMWYLLSVMFYCWYLRDESYHVNLSEELSFIGMFTSAV